MAIDRSLAARARQLQEALDLLSDKHGAQSETAAVIRTRLEEVQADIAASEVDRSGQESHTGDILESWGAPKAKDAALMYVILGAILIFAFGGMSTMFILMLAARW